MRSSRNSDFPSRSHPFGSRGGSAATVGIVDAEMPELLHGSYFKLYGGTYTGLDCREWQHEQWDNERWQRGAEARRRKREQSVEERREWCRRRTCRRRMLAEGVDAPGPTSSG